MIPGRVEPGIRGQPTSSVQLSRLPPSRNGQPSWHMRPSMKQGSLFFHPCSTGKMEAWTCALWYWPTGWSTETPGYKVCRWCIPVRMYCAKSCFLLESSTQELAELGLLLNGDKTVVLTNEAQPPSHLWTQTGIKLQVKNGAGGRKWLGCILSVGKAGRRTSGFNHQCKLLPKSSLLIKPSSVTGMCLSNGRLQYFDAVVSPVGVFGLGHCIVQQKDLHQLDVACRKFLRAVVRPLSNLWSHPWHEILHACND